MNAENTIKIVTDASVIKVNGKYHGRAGVLILSDDDKVENFFSQQLGNVTSNEGEYLALLEGVKFVSKDPKYAGSRIKLHVDSKLVYHQLREDYKTNKAKFIGYQKEILKKCSKFSGTSIRWERRDRDFAMLADFASKNPRRTKSMCKSFKGEHVSKMVKKAVNFIIKDDTRAGKEN